MVIIINRKRLPEHPVTALSRFWAWPCFPRSSQETEGGDREGRTCTLSAVFKGGELSKVAGLGLMVSALEMSLKRESLRLPHWQMLGREQKPLGKNLIRPRKSL